MTNGPELITVKLTKAQLHYLRKKVFDDELDWTRARIGASLTGQPLSPHQEAAWEDVVNLGQVLNSAFTKAEDNEPKST